MLEGHLTSNAEYTLGNDIILTFGLTNTTNEDLSVLRWFTPLEGLVSPCLDVECNGNRIPYDGPYFKRVQPEPDDHALVKAGQTIFKQITLNDAYPMSEQGEYTVSVNTIVRYSFASRVPSQSTSSNLKFEAANISTHKERLRGNEVRFIVRGGELPKLTIGESERSKYGRITKVDWDVLKAYFDQPELALTTFVVKPPAFEGTDDPDKRALVQRLHNDAANLAAGAYLRASSLHGHPDINRWFGPTPAPFLYGGSVFWALKSDEITYDLDGVGCIPSNPAWAVLGSRRVHLCKRFWSYDDIPPNSRAGIIYHELTHCVMETQDFEYEVEPCLELAKTDPDRAKENADNHQYFAEKV